MSAAGLEIIELLQCVVHGATVSGLCPAHVALNNLTGHARISSPSRSDDMIGQLKHTVEILCREAAPLAGIDVAVSDRGLTMIGHSTTGAMLEVSVPFSDRLLCIEPLASDFRLSGPIVVLSEDDSLARSIGEHLERMGVVFELVESLAGATTENIEILLVDCRGDRDWQLKNFSVQTLLPIRDIEYGWNRSSTSPTLFWPFFDTDLQGLLGRLFRSPLSVLVADDSAPSLMATRIMLERLGCEVTVAEDGEQALELALARKFDVIFLDERMPGLYGSVVAERLCASPNANRDTLKVSMTGITEQGLLREIYQRGVDRHIEKPVSKLRLEEFLSSVTDRVCGDNDRSRYSSGRIDNG